MRREGEERRNINININININTTPIIGCGL
jgi:hypothetical protein